MAITEGDIYVCDFCGEDTGKFNNATGNHVPCEKLATLEGISVAFFKQMREQTRLPYLMLAFRIFEKSFEAYKDDAAADVRKE